MPPENSEPSPESALIAATTRLRAAWSARAASPLREFFVASHPDWRDDRRRQEQARQDLEFLLLDIPPEKRRVMRVLEVGCGSGRLAAELAPQVGAYAGFDIAPEMVRVAAERLAKATNAKVAIGDGATIPASFAGDRYDLVFAFAVFIHLPEIVLNSYLSAMRDVLAPGGQVRFQILVDPTDPSGFASPPAPTETPAQSDEEPGSAAAAKGSASATDTVGEALEQTAAEPSGDDLAGDDYLGPRYPMDRLRAIVSACFRRFEIYRVDPLFAYVVAER